MVASHLPRAFVVALPDWKPMPKHFICLSILIATGFMGGCSDSATRSVYAIGGHMNSDAVLYLQKDNVYFDSRSKLDDSAFKQVFPSLQKLEVTFLSLTGVPVTDAI